MALRLGDHWVWDSWVADDGENYHLFFLRAARSLRDPARRHYRASIGHAVSPNLRTWRVLPDALVAKAGLASGTRRRGGTRPCFADPAGEGWHMLITARAASGPVDGRDLMWNGCVKYDGGEV